MNYLLFITFISLLTSCSEIKESTVVLDTSCNPPCWHNITPGITTKDEAISILSSDPEIKLESIKIHTTLFYEDTIRWDFSSKMGDKGGKVIFYNDVVLSIGFWIKPESLTYSKLFEKIGEPEYIFALLEETERSRLHIDLINRSNGYVIVGGIRYHHGDKAVINPDDPVESLYYFDTKYFEALMTRGLIDYYSIEELQKGMKPWAGFGEIKYIKREW